MWSSTTRGTYVGTKMGRNGLTAVAIDKDKSSQYALRWTVDNLLTKGQTVILIHVVRKSGGNMCVIDDESGAASASSIQNEHLEQLAKDIFLTFHCFCSRKDIQCFDVILEDSDIPKAITDYVAHAAVEQLILGCSRHGFIKRLKTVDVPTNAIKIAPDFCTVYVISKTKISSVRNASRPAPFASPLYSKISQTQQQVNGSDPSLRVRSRHSYSIRDGSLTPPKPRTMREDVDSVRSPFSNASGFEIESDTSFTSSNRPSTDLSFISSNRPSTEISFVSSNRPSTDRISVTYNDTPDSGRAFRLSTSSASSVGSERLGSKASENSFMHGFSSSSVEDDDVEAEMRRLKQELQKTMELYTTASKEALTAKEMAAELHRWRIEEERRLEEARLAAEAEGGKTKTTTEAAEAAERIARLESQKRVNEELKVMTEKKEQQNSPSALHHHYDFRYRRYTIEEIEEASGYFAESNKIGEGGYGPVFKCRLDHTTAAVKVLRPDATQGKSQFNQEIEVLSCMRHPHLVLLLGACPEYGCLVYEYMANGSVEDRLFRLGNTPPLSWQLRFRIAAEIAIGLLFLHRTKPEPLVHRDLKPANILLDQNFVSKISDVGLARLVPPNVADDVTQYRMTSAAGTFCYIDPEYQQTGMLGVKSDVYSYGIILLQLITAKPAMGVTHHVQHAIENGTFKDILDDNVKDWPIDEALSLAKLGLQCAQLRRKDRPDLGKQVLPELNRLRDFAEQNMTHFFYNR